MATWKLLMASVWMCPDGSLNEDLLQPKGKLVLTHADEHMIDADLQAVWAL